ncbi:MAG: FAD-binding protein, partial [Phycisphaerales bacterium]|nr:FAD-binding protein [Phycisphaerales bacterium]
DGAVISLRAGGFEEINITDDEVIAGAGADFPALIRETIAESRVGLEALAGIPGAVGGAIRMNAGGRYGEVGQFVKDITVVDIAGEERVMPVDQVGFAYRRTGLDNLIITSARFNLPFGDREAAHDRYREIWIEKHDQQPPVAARSAGCIFKNPLGSSAGLLIDRAGLKGFRVGGARISERHANFILAEEAASSADVLRLIDEARDRVRRDANIELELEIQIW